jgi:hypothetical protein
VAAELSPSQLVAAARAAGLDFLAVTEHNTADTHGDWGDDLLVVLGQEVTTGSGHWLALGVAPGQVVDWRYGLRDGVIDQHLAAVRRAGGLCVAAHPHAPYPSGTLMYPFAAFDAVEVWNGQWRSDLPWQADNEVALAEWGRGLAAGVLAGRWLPAMGNSDTHLAGQIALPHTVVRAGDLSAAAVLAAVRAGRSWIAESATVDLSFTATATATAATATAAAATAAAADRTAADRTAADRTAADRTAGVGERLPSGDEPVEVRLAARGVPAGSVRLHTDRGVVHRETLPGDGIGSVVWHTRAAESLFVRAEVRHPDGRMAALTNPVLLT